MNRLCFALPRRVPGHGRAVRLAVVRLLILPVLASCGSGSAGTSTASSTADSASTGVATRAPAASVRVSDAWVKAAAEGMTAMFGTIRNDSAMPLTVTGASTDLATTVELHETVMVDGAMQMRPRAGGFTVEAGKTFTLAPGGNHVMLMGLTRAVKAGDQVTVTLKLGDGSTLVVQAIGKDFAGAKESYAGTPSSTAGM
jgi:periplasmic copper chaperone A